MIGGFKYSSRLALVAAAGMMAGSVAAQAADLGGNCCADLEERVAELEATTARKGTRKVSLEVSGHVNEALIFWAGDQDDTVRDFGVGIATNNHSRSRFRFKGSAKINADWSAGFLIEIGVRAQNSAGVRGADWNAAGNTTGLDIRHEALYLASKTLGTIWLGHTGSATEGITEICLGCTNGQGPDSSNYLGAFRPLGAGGTSWSTLANNGRWSAGEGDRRDIIMYQTPSLAGFILSAAYGSDEFYDVALRYAGEFGGIRIAAGVGYQLSNEQAGTVKGFATPCVAAGADNSVDCEAFGASASVMHVPTGLYIAGSYGVTQDNNAAAANDRDEHWYVTAGINKKFFAIGATNLYGEYGIADRTMNGLSEVTFYGVGIGQQIDAAAMEIYVNYKRYEGENGGVSVADLDMVVVGAMIKF